MFFFHQGDFYLTRHSNLSQVHVVCHLVAEDRTILDPGLRARDPVMQGLRNALRTIAKHGIRHITLPLLLTGQMKPVSQLINQLINCQRQKCCIN